MSRNARRRAIRKFVNRPSVHLLKLEQAIARSKALEVQKKRRRAEAGKPWKDPARQGRPRYPGYNRARAQRVAQRKAARS